MENYIGYIFAVFAISVCGIFGSLVAEFRNPKSPRVFVVGLIFAVVVALSGCLLMVAENPIR
jgi:small basic protein